MKFKRDTSFLKNQNAFRSNALTRALGIRKAFTSKESLAEYNDLQVEKKTQATAQKALVDMGLN